MPSSRSRITSTRSTGNGQQLEFCAPRRLSNRLGVKLKAALFATGYQPDVINSPAWSALQGDYFYSSSVRGYFPTQQRSRCRRQWRVLTGTPRRTSPRSASTGHGWARTWMIKGLQLAGPNPMHASVIKALRGVKSYNANSDSCPSPWTLPPTSGTTSFRAAPDLSSGQQDRLCGGVVAALLWGRTSLEHRP